MKGVNLNDQPVMGGTPPLLLALPPQTRFMSYLKEDLCPLPIWWKLSSMTRRRLAGTNAALMGD